MRGGTIRGDQICVVVVVVVAFVFFGGAGGGEGCEVKMVDGMTICRCCLFRESLSVGSLKQGTKA